MLGQTLRMKCYRVEHRTLLAKHTPLVMRGPYASICWGSRLEDDDHQRRLGRVLDRLEPPLAPIRVRKHPVIWFHPRPGAGTDPYLKEKYLGNHLEFIQNHAFVCCDLEQLRGWTNDYELKTLLREANFTVREYLGTVTVGLRQGVMDLRKPVKALRERPDLLR